MRVWRVAVARAAGFDGEGTRRAGSRWVPKGLAAMYTSATLSLAALELFVHTDPDLVPAHLVAIPADVPDNLPIIEVQIADLPAHWRASPPPEALQDVGRAWHAAGRTAIVSVPSAIVPLERNYILNPAHGDFSRIRIGRPIQFSFDPRMWK